MNPEMTAAMAALSAAAAAGGDPAIAAAFAADIAAKAAGAAHARPPMPFDVMTAAQVAAYLQVSEATVLAEANAGRLPGRRIAGEWRFIHIALTEWMRATDRPHRPARMRPRSGVGASYTDEDPERIIAELYAARHSHRVTP